jgi:hypothetical protein
MPDHPRFVTVLAVLLGLLLPAAARAQPSIRVVARSGDSAPGLPGLSFAAFGEAVMNESGAVLFRATLQGPGVGDGNDYALFRADPSSGPVLVLREGQSAPGLPGGLVWLGSFRSFLLNDAGHVVVDAYLDGTPIGSSNDQAIYADLGTGLELVLREGDPLPALGAGFVVANPRAPRLADTGEVVLKTSVGGASAGAQAVVRGDPSGVEVVAVSGGQPPGFEPGAEFGQFSNPSVSPSGRLAFLAAVSPGLLGIFGEPFGALDLLVRSDSDTPGFPGQPFYPVSITTDAVRVDGAGRIAFRANSFLPPGQGTLQGIWAQRSGGIDPIVVEGDPVPGLAGTTFAGDSAYPLFAADGTVAAVGTTFGPAPDFVPDTVLWRDAGGGAEIALQVGDLAFAGQIFPTPTFAFFAAPLRAALTDAGALVVWSHLTGNAVSDIVSPTSLWWIDAAGARQRLIRAGEEIPVAPGESRTVEILPAPTGLDDTGADQTGTSSGGMSAVAELGVAAVAELDDGSTVLLVVPEPGALALGGTALGALVGIRARRSGVRPRR